MDSPRDDHPANRLGNLLEQEYFLARVLKHLADDELYECSLVCRRWREVVLQMLTRLPRIPWKMLTVAASSVHKVTSISLDTQSSRQSDLCCHPYALDLFHDLESLSVMRAPPSHAPSFCFCLNHALSVSLPSLSQLLSLTVHLSGDYSHGWIAFAVKHLTKLTFLRLSEQRGFDSELAPIWELHRIEELCVQPNFFINRQGEHTFPALTNLTRLEMTDTASEETTRLYEGRLFEILQPYASTLKSLCDASVRNHMWPRAAGGWSALRDFIELESLLTGDSVMLDPTSGLWETLRGMGCVRDLKIGLRDFTAVAVDAALRGLNRLRSLTVVTPEGAQENSGFHSVTLSTNLTELCVNSAPMSQAVRRLTGLVRLGICLDRDSDGSSIRCLSGLCLLEELSVKRAPGSGILGDAFSCLTGLRKLALAMGELEIEEHFFPHLEPLKRLTSFELRSRGRAGEASLRHLCKITILTTLRELTLDVAEMDPRLRFTEGCLPRLRTLRIGGACELSEGERRDLKNRFRCLNNLQ